MLGPIIYQVKLLIIILADLLHRMQKFVTFVWSGKHEIERICDSNTDIYDKCMKIDQWLGRTRCESIQTFLHDNFANGSSNDSQARLIASNICGEHSMKHMNWREKDKSKPFIDKYPEYKTMKNRTEPPTLEECDLNAKLRVKRLAKDLFSVIKKAKCLQGVSTNSKDNLRDSLYRIVCFKMSLLIAEYFASIKYNDNLTLHSMILIKFWNNLVKDDQRRTSKSSRVFSPDLSSIITDENDVISNRWSHIGFQGQDPGTDFRGTGFLGLVQLEYLSRKPKSLAVDLLRRSLDKKYEYPFAIVGINLTYNLISLFRDNSMKHLYYDTDDILFKEDKLTLNLVKTLNDLFVELFLRFDCFWRESKPKTIFEFKELMEKFIDIIRMDLRDRNFALKFIY